MKYVASILVLNFLFSMPGLGQKMRRQTSGTDNYQALVGTDEAIFIFPVQPGREHQWSSGGLTYSWNVTVNNNGRRYEFGFYLFTAMGASPGGNGNIQALLRAGQCSIWRLRSGGSEVVEGATVECLVSEDQKSLIVKLRGKKSFNLVFSSRPKYVTFRTQLEVAPFGGSKPSSVDRVAVKYSPVPSFGNLNSGTPRIAVTSPASPTSSLPPARDVIRLQTKSGIVEVKNFYKTAVYSDDNFVFFDTPGDKDYHIQYNRQDSSFVIQLPTDTREKARTVREIAQSELLEKLGIDKKNACNLTVYVLGPKEFPRVIQNSYNYGLSFCPGSKRL